MYVGLSKVLHRRLRRYSNRAFKGGSVPLRGVHTNIFESVRGNIEVAIFAKVIPGVSVEQLLQLETALILKLQPKWNGTHRNPN